MSLSLPGEWVRHERTIMFWPCRESMWGSFYGEVQDESARVANTIAQFEIGRAHVGTPVTSLSRMPSSA